MTVVPLLSRRPRSYSELPREQTRAGLTSGLHMGFQRVTVSTVILVNPDALEGMGRAELDLIVPWEVAVFPGDLPADEPQLLSFRFATRPEAQAAHDALVEYLRRIHAARCRKVHRTYRRRLQARRRRRRG